jgi:hypothetical protein
MRRDRHYKTGKLGLNGREPLCWAHIGFGGMGAELPGMASSHAIFRQEKTSLFFAYKVRM